MPKERVIRIFCRLAGILLLMASVLHGIIVGSEVLQAVKFGDVRPSMTQTIWNLWLFSCALLLLSGIWVLALVAPLGRLDRRAWWQALTIGIVYTGVAVTAMALGGIQIHLLGYALIGLLLVLPMLRWAGSFSYRNIKNH